MTDHTLLHGYCDGDIDTNNSSNRSLWQVVAERRSRRDVMRGGLKASAIAFLGTGILAACDDDTISDNTPPPVVGENQEVAATSGQAVFLEAATSGEWTQVEGPEVQLEEAPEGRTGFIAPAVAQATTLSFSTDTTSQSANRATVTVNPAQLNFTAVAKNMDDVVTVPAGYAVTVMTRLGDPIKAGVADYQNDGTDSGFDKRIGDHGDALAYYGLSNEGARDDSSSKRGLLVQNHENLDVQYLHPNGPTDVSSGPRPEVEAIKEIEAHGISVTEFRDEGARSWRWIQDSPLNRRITPNTPASFHGPARGSDLLKTAYSADGTRGRGTINNCANGRTLWGTNLTCEENWAGYFRRDGDDAERSPRELTALRRYGVTSDIGNYAWSTVTAASADQSLFRRWDARAGTGLTAADDYRNEPNQFGWVVEIDPFDPTSEPRKRTALGRMGHEGAWLGRLEQGKKVAVYMGDDARGEYFYKFVSDAAWQAQDGSAADRLGIGDKYLDAGTLYVARFDPDGTGVWLPLSFGSVPNRPATGSDPEYVFESQQDILVNTRLAADAVAQRRWTALNGPQPTRRREKSISP